MTNDPIAQRVNTVARTTDVSMQMTDVMPRRTVKMEAMKKTVVRNIIMDISLRMNSAHYCKVTF